MRGSSTTPAGKELCGCSQCNFQCFYSQSQIFRHMQMDRSRQTAMESATAAIQFTDSGNSQTKRFKFDNDKLGEIEEEPALVLLEQELPATAESSDENDAPLDNVYVESGYLEDGLGLKDHNESESESERDNFGEKVEDGEESANNDESQFFASGKRFNIYIKFLSYIHL